MTTSRKPLIVGNWKMNKIGSEALDLARQVAADAVGLNVDVVVCPPNPYLQIVADTLSGSNVCVGGQDCHALPNGAHTGDVSAVMLGDVGCRYVVVGHSERRIEHGEDDSTVRSKAEAAWSAGLTAIICVGESQAERDQGQTLARISAQLESSVPKSANAENTVIAYEPIWAIGSGVTPTLENVQEVHSHIRLYLGITYSSDVAEQVRVLYGGSVKPDNARELLALADVDGGLVGGASLDANGFFEIARSTIGAME